MSSVDRRHDADDDHRDELRDEPLPERDRDRGQHLARALSPRSWEELHQPVVVRVRVRADVDGQHENQHQSRATTEIVDERKPNR